MCRFSQSPDTPTHYFKPWPVVSLGFDSVTLKGTSKLQKPKFLWRTAGSHLSVKATQQKPPSCRRVLHSSPSLTPHILAMQQQQDINIRQTSLRLKERTSITAGGWAGSHLSLQSVAAVAISQEPPPEPAGSNTQVWVCARVLTCHVAKGYPQN